MEAHRLACDISATDYESSASVDTDTRKQLEEEGQNEVPLTEKEINSFLTPLHEGSSLSHIVSDVVEETQLDGEDDDDEVEINEEDTQIDEPSPIKIRQYKTLRQDKDGENDDVEKRVQKRGKIL